MDKKYRLTESKVFCMAPWLSINNNPNGDILPCCVSKFDKPFGNLYENDIETIWNNEAYTSFRKNMLNDIPCSECVRCYKEEEWGTQSYRSYWNQYFGDKYKELVENETDDNGYVSKIKFYRWDFRFNNLCNLSCIGCGPALSSSWIDLHKRMWPSSEEFEVFNSNRNKEGFVETIKNHATIVEEVYFAGGEPLLHSEHYEILNELNKVDRLGKILFTYSTNLTKLTYKNQNILDYWKKMKRCKVLVSLDEIDAERLHYIRYPSQANEIIENIRIINNTLTGDNQYWSIVPTWGLLNIHRIKEIAQFFYDNNLLPANFNRSPYWESDFHNITLMHPKQLSMVAAPVEWKKVIHEKINEYEEWYKDVLIPLKAPFIRQWSLNMLTANVQKFRNALDETLEIDTDYKDWFARLDNARETDFRKTFPELSWHLD